MKKLSWSIILLVSLVSFASMGMEISLTRIFSLVYSYYYLFLSVSIALCGIGLGGYLATIPTLQLKNLRVLSLILAISYVLSVIIPLKIVFFLSHPLILSIIFLPSFIITGLLIALVFQTYHSISGLIYFSDLVGAGIGSLLIVMLLRLFSPINIVVLFAVIILIATYLLTRKKECLVLAGLLAVLIVLNRHNQILDVPYGWIPATPNSKSLVSLLQDRRVNGRIEKTYWSPSFRTDIVRQDLLPGSRGIFIDGGAPTVMYKFDGDLNSIKWLKNTITYFPFQVAQKDRVLCIGPGGGADILLGLLAGYHKIDAVEVNDCIPKVMRDYKDFNGRLLENKQVEFIVSEGRSYLKNTENRYDLIYLALALTKTSSRSGLPLVESYLHTLNAYEDYIAHLNPGGIIAMLCETKPFLLRMTLNILLALKKDNPDLQACKKHIMVLANPLLNSSYKYLILIKREEFTEIEAKGIFEQADARGFSMRYCPYIQEKNFVEVSSFRDIPKYVREIRRTQGIDISPTTDDKPLFYDLSPYAPSFLYAMCIVTFVLSVITALGTKRRIPFRISAFFILLGAGFMLIEVSLTQKFLFFLGSPITTFSIILVSLLTGSGVGGLYVYKIKNSVRWLPVFSGIICLIILSLFFCLSTVFLKGFGLNNFGKGALSFAALFILGVFMGMPFPIIIREAGKIIPAYLGFMWGTNGLMSIFGSSLSIIITKTWGIRYSLLLAFFIYLIVMVNSIKLKTQE